MPGLLDPYPLDWTRPALRELRDLLAGTYYRSNQVERLLLEAGISPADVFLEQRSRLLWQETLNVARGYDRLAELLSAVRQDPRTQALGPRLDELLQDDEPAVETGPAAVKPDRWQVPATTRLEALVDGVSTLLPIAFLEQGVARAAAVARLKVAFATSTPKHGTAFRIGDDLLLTNHHVLHDGKHGDAPAAKIIAWFNYEHDTDGKKRKVESYMGRVETIIGNKEHDWAVVRAETSIADRFPILELGSPIPLEEGARVYIVQHPSGGPKQIGMHRNVVTHASDAIVQYRTDTEGGSSGSPVFDDSWRVVALHHAWTDVTLDDGSVQVFNQGRRIERVIEGLEQAGLQAGLQPGLG